MHAFSFNTCCILFTNTRESTDFFSYIWRTNAFLVQTSSDWLTGNGYGLWRGDDDDDERLVSNIVILTLVLRIKSNSSSVLVLVVAQYPHFQKLGCFRFRDRIRVSHSLSQKLMRKCSVQGSHTINWSSGLIKQQAHLRRCSLPLVKLYSTTTADWIIPLKIRP